MPDARGSTVTARLGARRRRPTRCTEWTASGRTITFPGYLAVYGFGGDDAEADGDIVGQAARAHRGTGVARARHRGARPRHAAAGAVHRGDAGARARGEGHRPPVDVRVDHADDPRPRLRVEEGPGAGPDHRRVRGRQPARAPLRRSRRLRLHRAHGGRPRRDRRAARSSASRGSASSGSATARSGVKTLCAKAHRGGRSRGDQRDPARRRRRAASWSSSATASTARM